MTMSCSVSSCLCQGTCLPGSYRTRQSSACSPPIAWSRTPSTNSHESRPFHVRKGLVFVRAGVYTEVPLATGRRHRFHGEMLVEHDSLAVDPRLSLLRERGQYPIG